MPEIFDWQTEDNDEWDGLSAGISPGDSSNKFTRLWKYLLVGILILVISGLTIYWRARDTVSEVENQRIDEILASQQLIDEAIGDGDLELFRTFLSGADLAWAETQQELFRNGWLRDRRPFGLSQSPIDVSHEEIELSPDLNSALLSTKYRYNYVDADGNEGVATLRKEAVYRLGSRWLLSPPREEYWGSNQPGELSGRIVQIEFPERDKDIATEIFDDLDDKLFDLCFSTSSLPCPPNISVRITLSTNPDSIVGLMNAYFQDGTAGSSLERPRPIIELILPTPSLVGVPTDETSHELLLQAYRAYAAGWIVNQFIGDACCEEDELHHASVQSFLAHQALKSFPFEYVAIDDPVNFQEEDYGLQLMCRAPEGSASDLYVLNSGNGVWTESLSGHQIVDMQGLPGGKGVALLENIKLDEDRYQLRLVIRADSNELLLYEKFFDLEGVKLVQLEVRERERRLLLEIPRPKAGYSDFVVFDLTNCNSNGCPMERLSLTGRPYWPPEGGNQWLIRQNGHLWRREGYVNIPISDGYSPFWIDEDSFGYIRKVGPDQVIVKTNDSSVNQEQLIPVVSLVENLVDLSSDLLPRVALVLPDPAAPDSIWYLLAFLVDRNERVTEAVVLEMNPGGNDVRVVQRSKHLNSLALANSGGKIALSSYDPITHRWQILIDQSEDQAQDLIALASQSTASEEPSLKWSPNGSRLAVLNGGILTIWSQHSEIVQNFLPPVPGCSHIAWTAVGSGYLASDQY